MRRTKTALTLDLHKIRLCCIRSQLFFMKCHLLYLLNLGKFNDELQCLKSRSVFQSIFYFLAWCYVVLKIIFSHYFHLYHCYFNVLFVINTQVLLFCSHTYTASYGYVVALCVILIMTLQTSISSSSAS